jgi:hypothetical protein
MSERLLFLTGHLAYPRLERIMRSLGETPFVWEIRDIGVKVAALMTAALPGRWPWTALFCPAAAAPISRISKISSEYR